MQAIHNESPRRIMPFVAQNCAALPESLLDALLFGSVKGSFTGARDLPGLFELPDKGTLFLDELNALPLPLQYTKLLRVLETGSCAGWATPKPQGGCADYCRHVPGPQHNPCAPDLVLPAQRRQPDPAAPAAKKRRHPLLCRHFLAKHNAKLGTRVTGISAQALELLKACPYGQYPGIVQFAGGGAELPQRRLPLSPRTCRNGARRRCAPITAGKGCKIRREPDSVSPAGPMGAISAAQPNTCRYRARPCSAG